jgi:hypothetical protein
MKKRRLLLMLLLLGACYRPGNLPKDTTPPTYKIEVSGLSTYYYSKGNLKDSLVVFNVNDNDSLSLSFSVGLISGNPENYPITFSLDSLPAGITTTAGAVVFKPDYSFQIKLNVHTADIGDYLVNAKVTDSGIGTHTYPINLHVISPHPLSLDCSDCLVHNWASVSGCNTLDTCHPTITQIAGMPHWVRIQNINCLGDSVVVNAFVSCTDGITIPMQTSRGYTIYGYLRNYPCGNLVAYTIPDTVVHNGDTSACGFTLKNF